MENLSNTRLLFIVLIKMGILQLLYQKWDKLKYPNAGNFYNELGDTSRAYFRLPDAINIKYMTPISSSAIEIETSINTPDKLEFR